VCYYTLISSINKIYKTMFKTNTVLGKAAALAVFPALAFGVFVAPGAVSSDTTVVGVKNTNAGVTMTEVVSLSNSGGNTIVSDAASVGGNSGDSRHVTAGAGATAANKAEVKDVEVESRGGEAEADVAALAAGDAAAHSSAKSTTGNGGSAGMAASVNTIVTGDARSDVAIIGGVDHNEVNITITDACCDRKNTYHEQASMYLDASEYYAYDFYYYGLKAWEKEESKHGKYGGWKSESSLSEKEKSEKGEGESELSMGSDWSVTTETYVPVTTVIAVENHNASMDLLSVASAANTGDNTIVSSAASVGGNSGDSEDVSAGAGASATNKAEVKDVEVESKYGSKYSKGDAEADVLAAGDGNALATADVTSRTGHAGNADDAVTDNMILSGRSDSFVTVVRTSLHNVVRILR
jgi:hypothetical protein